MTNQLIYLVHGIFKNFDCVKILETRSVYLDMSKAFDKVWHEVTDNVLKLFGNYLSDRKQKVALKGTYSDWGSIKPGVLQGSVQDPSYFLCTLMTVKKGLNPQTNSLPMTHHYFQLYMILKFRQKN